jgi:hypothetical protein
MLVPELSLVVVSFSEGKELHFRCRVKISAKRTRLAKMDAERIEKRERRMQEGLVSTNHVISFLLL